MHLKAASAWLAAVLPACSFSLSAGSSIDDGVPGSESVLADAAVDAATDAMSDGAMSDGSMLDSPVIDAPPAALCKTDLGYVAAGATGIRYRASTTARSWASAQADCATKGAHLVVINNVAENQHVDSLLTTEIWIGYSDQAVEGTFVWAVATSSYTNWRPDGNPNDGSGTEPQDCAEIDEDGSGLWNDDNCPEADTYVCECPP